MNRSSTRCIAPLLAGMILPVAHTQAEPVQETFQPSGITQRMGGYRPLRAEMDQEADIVRVAPDSLSAPRYGHLEIGDQKWAFILDEPEDKPAKLYIDSNGDGDLTNDPETQWESKQQGELTMHSGEGQVDLGGGKRGALGLYRFDPNDSRRAQLKNTLLFYPDYGVEFAFTLDGTTFATFVDGSVREDSSLPVDRDGNGKISGNFERVKVGEPFNFTGSTYVFQLTDGRLTLTTSADTLPQMPLPPNLEIGQPALPFAATTMDGTHIDFPKHYAGKIVMLDFWATWCGPCIGEIPHMKEAYDTWHDQGFEILGISFDQEDMTEKLTQFLQDRELPWSQIYEGKGWNTSLGKMYNVSGIPFVLLVDGDSGTILATARELRGEGLSDLIGTHLKKKNPGDR